MYTDEEARRMAEARVASALRDISQTHITLKEHEEMMHNLRKDCVKILNQKPGALQDVSRHMVDVDSRFFSDPMLDAESLTVRVTISGLLKQLAYQDANIMEPLINEIVCKVSHELKTTIFKCYDNRHKSHPSYKSSRKVSP